MKARTHKQDYLFIVYDADQIRHPDENLFEPGYWEQQNAVVGKTHGRGQVLMLETSFGSAVLKQYLRGGWAARVSRDRYVFSGFERSRPLMEFTVLKQLSAAGLPAPAPLAAICRRHGNLYSGWLLTRRIMNVETLAELIVTRKSDPDLWRNTGACVRQFHNFGLIHADLNARNILLDKADKVHLVDFDRARIRAGDSRAFSANLSRLHRSLEKIWPESFAGELQQCWEWLLDGYEAGGSVR